MVTKELSGYWTSGNISDYCTSSRSEYFKQMKIFIKKIFCSEKRTKKHYFLTNVTVQFEKLKEN
jgi:hypothetical protein